MDIFLKAPDVTFFGATPYYYCRLLLEIELLYHVEILTQTLEMFTFPEEGNEPTLTVYFKLLCYRG